MSWVARVLIAVGVMAAAMFTAALPANADEPNYPGRGDGCGASKYVQEVWVERYSLGQFKVRVDPTTLGVAMTPLPAVTNGIWHSVQKCVPGLYDDLADSIYAQIKCHVDLTLPYVYPNYTGTSFDLESWRPVVGWDVMLATKCQPGGPYDQYVPEDSHSDDPAKSY